MRVAPLAWAPGDVFALAAGAAGLTHGHPSGRLASGAQVLLLSELAAGATWDGALATTLARLATEADHDETTVATNAAVELARSEPVATPELVESLGEGWVAEEALSISIYCALTAADLHAGLVAAVNHSGDSDSTGAITGNLLGTVLGSSAIPAELLEHLAERDVMERAAHDLAEVVDGAEPDRDRYPI